ncbi:MAG: hypothetical protein VX100_02350 [Pseudomonadota bacterium]|nr:hypothetical protein [Pseudomonadota bacterium]
MKIIERVTITKEIFSIFAAACVAGWAVYGTWVKREQSIAELKVIELEQKTSLVSSVLTNMTIEQFPTDNGIALSVRITLENTGNEDVSVSLDKDSILISKMSFEDGQAVYDEPVYLGQSRYIGKNKITLPYVEIGPHEKYDISYAYEASQPGIYLVRFLSSMHSNSLDSKTAEKYGKDSLIKYSAGIDRIVNIQQ